MAGAIRKPAAAALAALATILTSCGGDSSQPSTPAGIDYIAGAIEPVLTRGEEFVVEGFGFGDDPGLVLFTRIGGGTIESPVADSLWSPFAIAFTVPDSAAAGHVGFGVETAAGARVTATINVLPRATINPATLTWVSRGTFPGATSGIALTKAQFPGVGTLPTSLYAVGGAEPPAMVPDSLSGRRVYVARVTTAGGGAIGTWKPNRLLPAARAFATAVVGTPFNSRFRGNALYVIGGLDSAGRAQSSVFAADVTADSVTNPFITLEPLPAPRAGAIAVIRHGRIYVLGGTDTLGRPQTTVFTGRIGDTGHIDGWFTQPALTGPRAYGAGIARAGRVVAIGGVSDSVPPGGGVAAGTQRLVTGDTAAVSPLSGFFTGGWGVGTALLPEGRSQFALFDLDSIVLAVGGMYAGAATNSAEMLAATVVKDSVGPFTGPAGANRISDLMCQTEPAGTLVGPAQVTWQEADGARRGLLVGGLDLATQARRSCVWGW
ncbi:MAG TPA: hypothetical protein VMR92_13690 [Gemmatimonadales bacterium]|nr:hypothetical protein [Gemmatimonadales bacterium]